jgi:hypothetical protein
MLLKEAPSGLHSVAVQNPWKDLWEATRSLFRGVEKIHTIVWLVEIIGGAAILATVAGFVSAHAYWVIGLVFAESLLLLLLFILWRQAPRKREPLLLTQVHRDFERLTLEEGKDVNFKRKVRIVFVNTSGQNLEIQSPGWLTGRDDLVFQPHNGPGAAVGMRTENVNAGGWKMNQWMQNESPPLTLVLGRAFEVWVGLSHDYTYSTIDLHVRQGTIGTLVFPVLTAKGKQEVRVRVG